MRQTNHHSVFNSVPLRIPIVMWIHVRVRRFCVHLFCLPTPPSLFNAGSDMCEQRHRVCKRNAQSVSNHLNISRSGEAEFQRYPISRNHATLVRHGDRRKCQGQARAQDSTTHPLRQESTFLETQAASYLQNTGKSTPKNSLGRPHDRHSP